MDGADGEVTVLQDPSAYIHSIRKDTTARWVRGLTPIEETPTESDVRPARRPFPHAEVHGIWWRHWLRLPLLLGAMHLAARADSRLASAPFDFPESEDAACAFAAHPHEDFFASGRRLFPLWGPSVLAALFGLFLAWRVGRAARHFTALCGVGVALLALIATAAQFALLRIGCGRSPISGRVECAVPFVLYWTLTVARVGGPLLAVWCVTPVLDTIRRSGRMWRTLLGVPLVLFAVATIWTVWNAVPALAVYTCCHHATTIAWIVFIFSCTKQRPFQAVYEVKSHQE